MTQVTTVGQVKTHETLTRAHQSLVDLQVGRRTTQTLNVDTPLSLVQTESGEGAVLASDLNGIDVLVATVVTGTWVTLGVLVGHGSTKSLENGTGGEVLGGDQDNGLALALDLTLLCIIESAVPMRN